jgi:tetratricopeptide (TPR) repeat protein
MNHFDDSVILNQYPYQIAENYRLYKNIKQRDSSERFKKLLDIYEVVIKTFGSIVIRRYLLDDIRNSSIDNKIKAFESPAVGHWVGILRDIINEYKKKELTNIPILSELMELYSHKISGGQQSEVYKAVQDLIPFIDFKGKPGNSNAAIIDFCNTARNYILGHGALLSPPEFMTVVNSFEVIIFDLLQNISFIKQFSFIYIDEVTVERSVFNYSALLLKGTNLNRTNYTIDTGTTDGNLIDQELYICLCEQNQDNQYEIKTALSLSPLMILSNCEKCTNQLFIYNGKKNKDLQYLSYQCGHFYSPPSLKDEFSDIEKLINGEVSSREIFLSKSLGMRSFNASRISSYKEVSLSSKLADEGLKNIREFNPEAALFYAKDALKLNPDSAKAYHCMGLSRLALLDLDSALESAQTACKLDPQKVSFWLAAALIALEKGLLSEGHDYLNHIIEIDASHYTASQLLFDIDNFEPRISKAASDADKKEIALDIIKLLFEKDDVEKISVRGWIMQYPPWSWIEKAPFHPVVGSFFAASTIFLIMNLANLHRWSVEYLAKFSVVCSVIFLGCYGVFYVSDVIADFYHDLKRVILLPPETFKRWYLIEISKFWGSINLESIHYDDVADKEDKSNSEPGNEALHEDIKYSSNPIKNLISKLYKRFNADSEILSFFLFIWLFFIPLQYVCASDPFKLDIGMIVHQLTGVIEAYCCVWYVHFAIKSFFMIPKVLNQPIRYFIDIPYDLSVSVFGKLIIRLSYLVPIFLFLFFAQHYVYQTHRLAPAGNLLMVIFVFMASFIMIIGPPVAILRTLKAMKKRKISQFLIPNERISEDFLRDPSDNIHKQLQEKAEYTKFLKKRLPVYRLLLPNYGAFLLGIVEVGIVLLYLGLILNNVRPF